MATRILQATFDGRTYSHERDAEPVGVVIKSRKVPHEIAVETQKVINTYFPELRGVLLYYTGSAYGKYLYDWKIAINPKLLKISRRKLRHTIAHELTHLIQYQQDILRERAMRTEYYYLYTQRIPKGELACEIWTYARHPDLVGPSGYHSFIPKPLKEKITNKASRISELEDALFREELKIAVKYSKEVHKLAKKAIELRNQGMREYISWFLDELGAMVISGEMP